MGHVLAAERSAADGHARAVVVHHELSEFLENLVLQISPFRLRCFCNNHRTWIADMAGTPTWGH